MDTVGFYVSTPGQRAGDIRKPGAWGSVIRSCGSAHMHFEREQQMEAIRRTYYAEKPSRFDANFLCFRIEDALWYRETYCPSHAIYAARFDSTSYPFHRAQLLCIPPLIGRSDDEAIHHYWKADLAVSEIGGSDLTPWEVLTLSPILIGIRLV